MFKGLWDMFGRHPLVADVVLAVLIAASSILSMRATWALQPPTPSPVLTMTLTLVAVLPLALRRRYPVPVLLFISAVVVALAVLKVSNLNFTQIALIIAIFSAAAYGGRQRNWASIACIVATTGSQLYVWFSTSAGLPLGSAISIYAVASAWNLFISLAIWWFGNTLRKSREQTAQLKESTAQLMREREENAHRAVLDERVRIARELHDVLAHHVSVMGIQAGAARQVLSQYPEKALKSLSLIETSSRQAVAELYRLLGLLRDEKQIEIYTAQPGLSQLEKLVADMQASGLRVEIQVEGQKREIPQTVDLSAYRIIEEALTNTLKHAGPAKATVSLDYQKDMLLLDIADSGKGLVSKEVQQSGGKGLIGMRERVRLLKGEFWAGNASNGGFQVKAKLPLAE